MGRLAAGLIVAAVGLLSAAVVHAQQPSPQAVAVLSDGTRVEGTLVEATPGQQVILELAGGERRTVPWGELVELILDGASEVKSIRPTSRRAGPDSASVAAGEGKRTTTVDASASGVTLQSDADCSTEDEICASQTKASLGKGIGVSYKRESVKRVKKPGNVALNIGLGGHYYGASGSNLQMHGGGGSVSFRAMMGTRLPGPSGGVWFAAYVEPTFAGQGVAMTVKTPRMCMMGHCVPESTHTSGAGVLMVQAGLGLQLLHFGRMDKKSLKQSGIGVALGGTAGYAWTLAEGAAAGRRPTGRSSRSWCRATTQEPPGSVP